VPLASKFILFTLLLYITGNPIVAIIVMLIILYAADRRFLGMTPSILRPFQLNRKLSRLRAEVRANPHHTSAKLELARVLVEKKKYAEATAFLEQVITILEDSADAHYELGFCYLKLGRIERGEAMLHRALELNPRVRYGEPYLRLGEAYATIDPAKAIQYLERFRAVHSSSCEAYYRLGKLYEKLGRKDKAKSAYRETLEIYRALPQYSRRAQRRWALLARLK
jgi:tetratricopeptide (TPR) repeat protein